MTTHEVKLRQMVRSLDASALEALSSRGLLRRAEKDLERGVVVSVLAESAIRLQLKVADFTVSLPESGVVAAVCSCPAAGVCQHILAAVLFLQKANPENETDQSDFQIAAPAEASLTQELLSITPEQLLTWASKAQFKAGLKLAGQTVMEVIPGPIVRIRFPQLNVEVRYVPGGGLDGVIVTGGKSDQQIVVAAIIGFQRAQGIPWQTTAEDHKLTAAEGAPRSRAEVLSAGQRLLEEMLTNGLAHVSTAYQQRWATLAVSALGVHLPRLALLFRSLGEEVALVVKREAQNDLLRMMDRMAQTHALCLALRVDGDDPRPDLVGLHRSRYEDIGHLELTGVAAWPWRTTSGYEGLTVLLWDTIGKRWNSWSESRPKHQSADFKPISRFTQPGPWDGIDSPRQLVRSSFRLMNARRNPNYRLSGSSKSRVLVTGPAHIRKQGLKIIEDWSFLTHQLSKQIVIGLREVNPLDFIFAIQPTIWGDRGFDAVNQVFTWHLSDVRQGKMFLEIAYEQFAEPAIKYLESVSSESLAGAVIIGRVQSFANRLEIHPFALHFADGTVTQLYFNGPIPPNNEVNASQAIEGGDGFEGEEEMEANLISGSELIRLLNEVNDHLLVFAEAGLAGTKRQPSLAFQQAIAAAREIGFTELASSLDGLMKQICPDSILHSAYINRLYFRALS